ncbi:hypothetical protein ACIQ1D_19575 [Lysinibacillus xylanilyticus]|uniref:hypothetical protein n=1 Tax=Lysinibacillus xylanilyticus TaxID=582475 RepID=UPI003812D8FA
MRKDLDEIKAMLYILQGKTVKADIEEGILEAEKIRVGLYKLTIEYVINYDKDIDRIKEYIYRGEFIGLIKSIKDMIGEINMYIDVDEEECIKEEVKTVHTIVRLKGKWKVNKTIFRHKGLNDNGDVIVLAEKDLNITTNKYFRTKKKEDVFDSYEDALKECERRNVEL